MKFMRGYGWVGLIIRKSGKWLDFEKRCNEAVVMEKLWKFSNKEILNQKVNFYNHKEHTGIIL